MNDKKICFIICANDELYFGECVKYIQWLDVPEGMDIEILEIREAASMTAGYNEGMMSSDAKYKVYLHSDVFIKNKYFIHDILSIFKQDAYIGMIGLVGCMELPSNGIMWFRENATADREKLAWEEYRYDVDDGYREVACVDGLLMATQYDIPWREDLFTGWDFYDISQCYEMRRKGWRVVVPRQKNDWYIHDDKVILQLWDYDKYRRVFLEEYKEDIIKYGATPPVLSFSKDFFAGEEREGFFINEEMKHAWAAQMEILMDIDRVCKEHGIRYFADFGTLLGAVRHKGFIPWDDDIDICMLREDYVKFFKIAPGELQGTNILLSAHLDDKWSMPFMRVINGKYISFGKKRLEKYHGCPYTMGVDIFPLDYLPMNQAERDVLLMLFKGVYSLSNDESGGEKYTAEEFEQWLRDAEDMLKVKFNRQKPLMPQVLQLADTLASLYREEESEEVGSVCFMAGRGDKPRAKEWYADTEMMPFEHIQIPVPKGYDDALKSMYGDYMKPIKNKAGHDYPFFKKQKEDLEKMVKKGKVSVPADFRF